MGGMTNPAITLAPKKDRAALLERERKLRRSGQWGAWQTLTFPPDSFGAGSWTSQITTAHRNAVFCVLDRTAEAGVRHLAVSSLTGTRPTWPEMQRIKNELAGEAATAIEVYPPADQVVDEADMFHIWVLPGRLPFGLHCGA
jgi:hypothetical protein